MIRKCRLLTGIVLLCSPLFAAAQTNAYVGVGLGTSDLDFGSTYDNTTAYEVYGGYSFMKNLSLEANYSGLGRTNASSTPRKTADASAYGLSLQGHLFFMEDDKLELQARAGVQSWDYDIEQSIGPDLKHDNGTDPSYGAGIFYHPDATVSLGLRYTLFDFGNDVTPSIATLSGAIRF